MTNEDQVNEDKSIGNAVVDRETVQGSWQYVETPLAAEVRAGEIVLRPHWKGAIGSEEIRDVVRLASAASGLYNALAGLAFSYDARDAGDPCWCFIERNGTHFERTGEHDKWCLTARAAFALVNKPASQADSE